MRNQITKLGLLFLILSLMGCFYYSKSDFLNLDDVNHGGGTVSDVVNPQLLIYLNFDEGSGNDIYDQTVNGYDFTLQNTPAWISGQYIGDSLNFDGSGNYLNCGKMLTSVQEGSILFWLYPTNVGANQHLFYGSDIFRVRISGGYLVNNLCSFFAESMSSTATLNNDQWVHVALTFNRVTQVRQIYINGVLDNSDNNAQYNPGDMLLWLATNSSFSDYYSGTIDEFRYYNYVLSEAEILTEASK